MHLNLQCSCLCVFISSSSSSSYYSSSSSSSSSFSLELHNQFPANMQKKTNNQKTKVVSSSLGIGLYVQFLTNNVVFNLLPLQVTNNTY